MRYAQIRSMDISNGEGIGVALFVQGCHFHCENCFNQETWDFDGGKPWTNQTKKQFIELAKQPYITRISILGGEPLSNENTNAIADLLNHLRKVFGNRKKIWLYTGYTFEELTSNIKGVLLKYIDVLVDGVYVDRLKDYNLKFRGSSNQRVIDVQATLKTGKVVLYTE